MNSQLATRIQEAKNASTLRSLVIYARMLGSSWGVEVVFDNTMTTAATDGQRIVLCPLDLGTEEDAVLLEGLIDHEAGVHCRFTDFEASTKMLQSQPEVIDSLSNVFEDIWGERELYRQMPGCAPKINRSLAIMTARGIFCGPTAALHPASTMINMLLCGLRAVKLNQPILADFYLQHRQMLEGQVGPELVDQIWSTAQRIDATSSSVDAIQLAIDVYALIKDAQQKAKDEAKKRAEEQQASQPSSSQQPSQPGQGQPQAGQGQQQPAQGQPQADPTQQGASPSPSCSPSDPSSPQPNAQPSAPQPGQPGQPGQQSNQQPGAGTPPSSDQKSDQPGSPSASAGADPSNGSQPGTPSPGSSQQPSNGPPQDPGQASPQAGPSSSPAASNSPSPQPGQPSPSTAPSPAPAANQNQLGKPGQKPSKSLTDEQIKNIGKVLDATKQQAGSGELADALVNAMSERAAPAGQGSYNAGSKWDLSPSEPILNPVVDHAISALSRPVAVRLGSKLDQILEVQSTATTELSVRGRRLSARVLPTVLTSANMRVFKRTDEAETLEVAVSLLQDISSSMGSPLDDGIPCVNAAGATTRALGDTLERFDVPFAVYQFGSNLTRVKSFDQRWRRTRSLHYKKLEGSTCTHQALNLVVPALAARSEERRLLILETDGIPSDVLRTVAALSEAMRLGINVAVFLVGSATSLQNASLRNFMLQLKSHGIPHAIATNSPDIANAVFQAVSAATSKR